MERKKLLFDTFVFCACCAAILWLQGCGMRRINLWGAEVEFADGYDIHAGVNNIREVDDRRGINSKDLR